MRWEILAGILHNSLFPPFKYGTDVTLWIIGEGDSSLCSAISPRVLSVASPECNSPMYIVHKTNGGCVEQIVLLKETLLVPLNGEQNFDIKSAITCMLGRFMRPWMACFRHTEDCQVVN